MDVTLKPKEIQDSVYQDLVIQEYKLDFYNCLHAYFSKTVVYFEMLFNDVFLKLNPLLF